jgi:hypothetical protein
MPNRIRRVTLSLIASFAGILALAFFGLDSAAAANISEPTGTKRSAPVDLNTPRQFPEILSQADWQARAKEIREQILVSCGLWPMPQKTPLHARIFGRIERDGYSIEKVYFQTFPGFYLAGNLYRPTGHGKGKVPAILNPHGHWKEGRLADSSDGSTAARCIAFARQGMIAFSYDMVGFNDTHFVDSPTNKPFYEIHRQFGGFGTNTTDMLWGISLLGLQTWNSIRALDFLESLPDVDPKRLACTGESGGGTQTYTLGAIDDRLAAQVPVVMVSHTMQGGCSCENAPGLRVKYSNMEIAAAAAPRPQFLVAATGDWTKSTLTVEGPAIRHIYELFKAADRFSFVRFDFNHNYNQTSREAVYEWLTPRLLGKSCPPSLKEQPYRKEPDADLRVFHNNDLPPDALAQEQFIQSRIQRAQDELQSLAPTSKHGLETFKTQMTPAWRHTLLLDWPRKYDSRPDNDLPFKAGKQGGGPMENGKGKRRAVIFAYLPEGGATTGREVADKLTRQLPEGFVGYPFDAAPKGPSYDQFTNFFTTYNRTKLQNEVKELINMCVMARVGLFDRVILCGLGRAGLPAILAAPAADAVIADCDELDLRNTGALLAHDLFCPGILKMGGFQTAAVLAAPHPLLLHNNGAEFPTAMVREAYKGAGAEKKLRIESARVPDEELISWITNVR